MNEFCMPCQTLANIVSTLPVSMDRTELLLLVKYINQCSESKHTCRCFLRNLEIFWCLIKCAVQIFPLVACLVDKLEEDCLLLHQMQQMVAENSNDSVRSDENSEDLEIEGFTLSDRSGLLKCCAFLLSENFYLYLAYQRIYLHIPVRYSTPTAAVKRNFFAGNLPAPLLFTLSSLLESSLLQRLATCLSRCGRNIGCDLLVNMMTIVLAIRPYCLETTLRRYVWPIRDFISHYLCESVDSNESEALRESCVHQLSESVWSLSRDFCLATSSLDTAGLDLSVKHLNSHLLSARLTGLHQICVVISYLDDSDQDELIETLSNYLRCHTAIETVFGPNLHVELVKQSLVLVTFLCTRGVLTIADLDCIWAAALMKHCNRQVIDLLNQVVKCMESELVAHLYSLLKTLKPSEHTDSTLNLTFTVIRATWNLWMMQNARRHIQMVSPGVQKTKITELDGSGSSELNEKIEQCVHISGDDASSSVDSISHELAKSPNNNNVVVAGHGHAIVRDAIQRKRMAKKVSQQKRVDQQTPVSGDSEKKRFKNAPNPPKIEKTGPLDVEENLRHLEESSTQSESQLMDSNESSETSKNNEAKVLGIEKSSPNTDGEEESSTTSSFQMNGIPASLRRALQHVRQTRNPILTPHGLLYMDGDRPVIDFKAVTNDLLLESLVRNRMHTERARSAAATNSDVSSDAATSKSDRMGDFDDDEEDDLVVGSIANSDEDEWGKNSDDNDIVIELDLDSNETKFRKSTPDTTPLKRCTNPSLTPFIKVLQQRKLIVTANEEHKVEEMPIKWKTLKNGDPSSLEIYKVGTTLLWDLLQEDTYNERLSVENENIALHLLQELFIAEPFISQYFVEGCLQNLKNHKSSIVSLKLLLLLITAFRQISTLQQTFVIEFWTGLDSDLIATILDDLRFCLQTFYAHECLHRFSEEIEIRARLNLLDIIYANRSFFKCSSLTNDQLAVVWECLSVTETSRNMLFLWLLDQMKSPQRASVNVEAITGLVKQKATTFNVKGLSAAGLALLQFLLREDHQNAAPVVISLMWRIALHNRDTNVAMAAMQMISSHYVYNTTAKEQEFVDCCMFHLERSCFDEQNSNVASACLESNLITIHRALNLLYSHIEAFRRKNPFLTRILELEKSDHVLPHNKMCRNLSSQEFQTPVTFNVCLEPHAEPMSLSLPPTSLIGEIKAEASHAFRSIIFSETKSGSQSQSLKLFVDFAATHSFCLGCRELTKEMDQLPLSKVELAKDNVVLSIRKHRSPSQNADDDDTLRLYHNLSLNNLIGEKRWDLLMGVIGKLDQLAQKIGDTDVSFRCKTYAARAWQIVQCLPSNIDCVNQLKQLLIEQNLVAPLSENANIWNDRYFGALKGHYFLYAVQVLEYRLPEFFEQFIKLNGFQFIVETLLSDRFSSLEALADSWSIEIVASLLKMVWMCLHEKRMSGEKDDIMKEASCSSKLSASKERTFNVNLLDETSKQDFLLCLMNICAKLASEKLSIFCVNTMTWSQVILLCFKLITSLLVNSVGFEEAFLSLASIEDWLSKSLLDCKETLTRKKSALEVGKMFMKTKQNREKLAIKTAQSLLNMLDKANAIYPLSVNHSYEDDPKDASIDFKDKETCNVSTKHYFWLTAIVIDYLKEMVPAKEAGFNVDHFCEKVILAVNERPIFEQRGGKTIDFGLIGLLQLANSLANFNSQWKSTESGRASVDIVFDAVFAPPSKSEPNLPKCKSNSSRVAAFDFLLEMARECWPNFQQLHQAVLSQNGRASHQPYPWDYWPRDERRSPSGFVGIANLGATCYMASAVQQLFMIPRLRRHVIATPAPKIKQHREAFEQLQRMFSFLQISERKAYNPKSFCKHYKMNHQPLNVTEQKDMNEFFTDLITKLDEMNPVMRRLVKSLFGGVMSNNVLSLDCDHVSTTTEIFYSVRCTVADMKDLYDSLNALTIADMLEGDNMYTCSHCNKKVRAEKRACFKQLPQILCFNTLRYTFNMVTMTKEKVNTRFSFPMSLNMAAYMEENFLPGQNEDQETVAFLGKASTDLNLVEYQLAGVTVHTGTAEGGHYYSFIRDRASTSSENWYSFNDAEVKQWDPFNMDSECFGGELTLNRHGNALSDRFMDLSYEKTNSAYMLFYERVQSKPHSPVLENKGLNVGSEPVVKIYDEFESIYQDNRNFVRDLMFFDHAYSEFVSQMCGHVPNTNLDLDPRTLTLMSVKLSVCYLLETLIHSKEKPTFTHYTEVVIKYLSSSNQACEWFLEYTSNESQWLKDILIDCPQKMGREVLQKLCMHAILQLRSVQENLYLSPWKNDLDIDSFPIDIIGSESSVTRFIKNMLDMMSNNLVSRQMNEFLGLLLDFGHSSRIATQFLLFSSSISAIINFYTAKSNKEHDRNNTDEEDSDEESGLLLLVKNACGLKSVIWTPSVLEKMLRLVTMLLNLVLEAKFESIDNQSIKVRANDFELLTGRTGYQFLMDTIKKSNNVMVCCNLIIVMCRLWPEQIVKMIDAIFDRIVVSKEEIADPFLLVLNTILHEFHVPDSKSDHDNNIVNHAINKTWRLCHAKPAVALKWFEQNLLAYPEVLESVKGKMEIWTDAFLFDSPQCTVRHSAAELLISCVNCSSIRQQFHQLVVKSLVLPARGGAAPSSCEETTKSVRQVFRFLLQRFKRAQHFADVDLFGTHRLVAYFNVMKSFLLTRQEKLMVVPFFDDLWRVYRLHMSDKQIKILPNKQALLTFWYMASIDCPELIESATKNSEVLHHFMYTYIFNHNEEEQTEHNRTTLFAFYGLLRLFCTQSSVFAESFCCHENFEFACRSISMSETLSNARDEIFHTIQVCMKSFEKNAPMLRKLREKLCLIYLPAFTSSKSHCFTFIRFLRLFETAEDKHWLLESNILPILFHNFFGVHEMHHNATGCSCTSELVELLKRLHELLKILIALKESDDARDERTLNRLLQKTVNMRQACLRLLELLNSYNPAEMRKYSIECLKKLLTFCDHDSLKKIFSLVLQVHKCAKNNQLAEHGLDRLGPYFPRRSHAAVLLSQQLLRRVHPPQPMLNMCLPHNLVEAEKGVDAAYDQTLSDWFSPYHALVDRLLRVACNVGAAVFDPRLLAECSVVVGLEGLPLHSAYFAKFWLDLWQKLQQGKDVKDRIDALKMCKHLGQYIESVFVQEQSCLSVVHIYNFVRLIVNELAPELLNAATKKQALELAANVLKEQSQLVKVGLPLPILENLPRLLMRRIGAIRILTLFFTTTAIPDSLQHENFAKECTLFSTWLTQNFLNDSSATTSEAPTDSHSSELVQIILKYVNTLNDVTGQLVAMLDLV